jgi:hypothetical protein
VTGTTNMYLQMIQQTYLMEKIGFFFCCIHFTILMNWIIKIEKLEQFWHNQPSGVQLGEWWMAGRKLVCKKTKFFFYFVVLSFSFKDLLWLEMKKWILWIIDLSDLSLCVYSTSDTMWWICVGGTFRGSEQPINIFSIYSLFITCFKYKS